MIYYKLPTDFYMFTSNKLRIYEMLTWKEIISVAQFKRNGFIGFI